MNTYLLTQAVAESEPICPRWSSVAVLGRRISYTKILSLFQTRIQTENFQTTTRATDVDDEIAQLMGYQAKQMIDWWI